MPIALPSFSGCWLCLVCGVVFVAEHVVHDACSAADRGHDHMPVDGLGHVGGLVPDRVAMSWIGTPLLLMIDTAVWRAFVSVPVADSGSPGHLAEPPVERVPAVLAPVLVAEHEVGVVVRLAGREPLDGLALLVRLQGEEGALRQGQGAPGFRRLDVAVLLAERQTWITPWSRSTRSQVSLRSSPGRRPSVIARTKSASSRTAVSVLSSMPSCERHARQVTSFSPTSISVTLASSVACCRTRAGVVTVAAWVAR